MNLTETFQRFVRSEQSGGVLLIGCTVLSLALANSPLAAGYQAIWHAPIGPLSLEHWINDALMAVFFLLIGLELEREVYVGELSNLRSALFPAVAAVGGMVAPALIHLAFNAGSPTESGFGIPMATDIAFALAILALLGGRVPPALKVFLVAFAVIDDLGAIVLIAIAYTAELSWSYLVTAMAIWGALIALNRLLRVMSLWPYLLGGIGMWCCLLLGGVHASIAGVLLAFAVPFTPRQPDALSPSHRLMHWLHKPVAFLILPLFALANTGIAVDAQSLPQLLSDNGLGISLGLLLGKPLGVLILVMIAVGAGVCTLPEGTRWTHIIGAGLIGGIGFTMSIFITNLAFAEQPDMINTSKLAVLTGSSLAGILGYLWLALSPTQSAAKLSR